MASVSLFGAMVFVGFYISGFTTPLRANFVSTIEINTDGHISDRSELPMCSIGLIQLLSYNYEFICGSNTCSTVPAKRLSDEAVVSVHRMCSLRAKCVNINSHFVESQNNFQSILSISYKCLGLFDTFIDICENITIAIASNKAIHLTNNGSAKRFEECDCSVKGRFRLTLADVRLQSTAAVHHRQCSPAELNVNHQKYKCEGKTGGSVFNKIVDDVLIDETINLKTNSADESPEMVYLTAKSEGQQTEVSCRHRPRIVTYSTTGNIQTEEVATDLYMHNKGKEQSDSAASQSVAMVAVGVGITLAVVLVVVFLRRRRRKQREKRCRLERLEMLVEKQLTQSQCQHQQGNNTYGEYSFARDDPAYNGGVGDYVDLVETKANAQGGSGGQQLGECNANTKKSPGGRLKNWISKTPKQEAAVYSYATHEPLLRKGEQTVCDETASQNANSCLTASNEPNGPFYFKLEPQQTPESDVINAVHNDDHEHGGNTKAHINISPKKKKKGKQKDLSKCGQSASRCNDTEAYDVPHYAVPVVDDRNQDNTKDNKTIPSVSSSNVSMYHSAKDKPLYANEVKPDLSGTDKYETIDVNRSVLSPSPNNKETRSPGILEKLRIKITKISKQKPTNETTETIKENMEETEAGELLLQEDHFNMDSVDNSQTKTGYDKGSSQELSPCGLNNELFVVTNGPKQKGFFGKKNLKIQTKVPNSHTNNATRKGAIVPIQKTEENLSIVVKEKHDDTTADEDHYDKLTMGDNMVPQHPNYDKVSVTKHGLSLKHIFRK